MPYCQEQLLSSAVRRVLQLIKCFCFHLERDLSLPSATRKNRSADPFQAPAETQYPYSSSRDLFHQAGCHWLAHPHRHHSFLKDPRSCYDSPSFPSISFTVEKRALRCSTQRKAGGPALLGICWFRLLALERYRRPCRAACKRGGSTTYQSTGFP